MKTKITIGSGYSGVRPITVYYVSILKTGIFLNRWIKIKGFEELTDAREFARQLRGN